jgi:hypothetical protein
MKHFFLVIIVVIVSLYVLYQILFNVDYSYFTSPNSKKCIVDTNNGIRTCGDSSNNYGLYESGANDGVIGDNANVNPRYPFSYAFAGSPLNPI